jgi:flagellar biosynthetic protein FliQ
MTVDALLVLGREALWLMLLASLPPIGASFIVGFLVSLLQATTQLQDSSLTVVPKLVASVGALVLSAPWISRQLVHFAEQLLWTLSGVAL